jgi:UDP-glucuronate 4-epimerase
MAGCYIVTGAAGFIGSHLVRALLDRGDRVVGVDNYDPFYDRGTKEANAARLACARFELVEADIRDRETMTGLVDDLRPAAIYHMAALAGVRPSIQDPGRYASVNVDGLVAVLDAARRGTCRRVLFASSSSVYGNNRKVPFAETDPVDEPISPYAATKRAGELICHAYSHLFGLSIACLPASLCPCTVTGRPAATTPISTTSSTDASGRRPDWTVSPRASGGSGTSAARIR